MVQKLNSIGLRHYLIFGLLVITSFFLPVLGFSALCYATAKRYFAKTTLVDGLFFSLLLAIVTNSFLYEIFNVVRIHPPINIVGLLYGICSIFIVLHTPKSKDITKFIDLKDIACLVTALIAFCLIMYPVIRNHRHDVSYSAATLHLLTSGEDNASHYAIYKYDYTTNGFAYLASQSRTGLIPTLINYPQSSEFTNSWFTRSVIGSKYINNDQRLILIYYFLCALNFALLIFWIARTSTKLYDFAARRFTALPALTTIIVSTAILTFGPILEILGRGFQSQISSYVFMVALISYATLRTYKNSQRTRIAIGLILFGGVSINWWFLCPVAIAPLLYIFWTERSIISNIRRVDWLGFGALGLLSIYPIILNFLSPVKAPFLDAVGGVDMIRLSTITLYLIGFFAVFLYPAIKKQTWPIVGSVSVLVVFTAFVALYQELTIKHLAYYYYKSLYSLIPLSAIIILAIFASLVGKLSTTLNQIQKILAVLLLLLLSIGLYRSTEPVYPRVYAHDWFNNPISMEQIGNLLKSTDNPKYTDAIFAGGCQPGSAYLLNRFAGAFYLSETPARQSFDLVSFNGVYSSASTKAYLVVEQQNPHVLVTIDKNCSNKTMVN